MEMHKRLVVENVEKVYGVGDAGTKALRGISFDVIEGEFLGIMGASGSGKTTLLNCIATMIRPTKGRILLDGKDITTYKGGELAKYRGHEIGYLFQEFELLDNLTAAENILLPPALHGVTGKDAASSLHKLAEHFDILDVLEKFPSQMSGGQKQRVAAARALISDPRIVLADEPTGALDSHSAKVLMDRLSELRIMDKKTILMVTHDAIVASYCTRILFIRDGQSFHELRRDPDRESSEIFYERIVTVLARMGGGSAHVL